MIVSGFPRMTRDPAQDRLDILLSALGTCDPADAPALERAVREGLAALPVKPLDLRDRWLAYRERKYAQLAREHADGD